MINLQETAKHLPIYIIVVLLGGIAWLGVEFHTMIKENREYFKRMVVYQDSICDKRLQELEQSNHYLREQLKKRE